MNELSNVNSAAGVKESPFHAGEQAVQSRLGVRKIAEQLGQAMIRPFMPEQHREFFNALSYLFVGIREEDGFPRAEILTGDPGFITSPDNQRLHISIPIGHQILATQQLIPGREVGLLGIDLATRRRNRINGVVTAVVDKEAGVGADKGTGIGDRLQIEIAIVESFGNCPKYIQRREISLYPSVDFSSVEVQTDNVFNNLAKKLINNADTFFIASQHQSKASEDHASADISHRGGEPGFIHIQDDKTLIFPDYSGNRHFNTLGNLSLNPGVGLLFIDFISGDLLHLRGISNILWNDSRQVDFPGAERLLEFQLKESLYIANGMALRGKKINKKPAR